jgi:hypothetical protein
VKVPESAHVAGGIVDGVRMSTGRVALLVTCVVVAGLGTWFALSRWDDANRIATVASALGAVAAVGVAVWAAFRAPAPERSVTVSDTGNATATGGGKAVTGVTGRGESVGTVRVERTGDAKSSGDGDAVTGVELD